MGVDGKAISPLMKKNTLKSQNIHSSLRCTKQDEDGAGNSGADIPLKRRVHKQTLKEGVMHVHFQTLAYRLTYSLGQ